MEEMSKLEEFIVDKELLEQIEGALFPCETFLQPILEEGSYLVPIEDLVYNVEDTGNGVVIDRKAKNLPDTNQIQKMIDLRWEMAPTTPSSPRYLELSDGHQSVFVPVYSDDELRYALRLYNNGHVAFGWGIVE